MTTLYKLTNENNETYNHTKWGENVTHSGTGQGELCGPGYIHAYLDPLLAVFLNPIHANFQNPKLWLAEGEVVKNDYQLKVGCVSLTTIKELELPVVTREQRIAFGILCAKEVYKDTEWNQWADAWLDGSDRTKESAKAADDAAYYAAKAAADDAAWAAAYAAYWAAKAAADAYANAAWAAYYAAARAAGADAAYWARAAYAAYVKKDIDLIQIAKKAMEY